MLLATYIGIRPGIQGIGNIAIRFRLNTKYTHSEVIFEPGDGVDDLMPDGTCEPDEDGALWSASSVFAERLPSFSPRRANKIGGVRFKRIKFDPKNWEIIKLNADPVKTATWFVLNQGMKYDYHVIASYINWLLIAIRNILFFIPGMKDDKAMCSESIARAVGVPESERIDPPILHNFALYLEAAK